MEESKASQSKDWSLPKTSVSQSLDWRWKNKKEGISIVFTKFEYALLKEISSKQKSSPANFIHRIVLDKMLELQNGEVK